MIFDEMLAAHLFFVHFHLRTQRHSKHVKIENELVELCRKNKRVFPAVERPAILL